ncbi:hypothetical protein ACX0HA_03230 [Flavobacterium hauense]
MKQTIKAVLFIAFFILAGCNKYEDRPVAVKEIEGFDYGRVRNNTYTNTFFNVKMDVPKGWQVQDEKQKEELMQQGRDAALTDDTKKNAAIKASEITTANLFTAFAHEPNTVPFNHNLIMIAENVGQYSFAVTPEVYLNKLNKGLSSGTMNIVQIDNSFRKKTLNGMDFYQMNLVTYLEDMRISQTYLITIEKGFAFGFIYTYADDAQKSEIEKAINSLRPYKES